MPKIRLKELDKYLDEELDKNDFTIIEMEKVPDGKLSSAVYEFARISDSKEIYNKVMQEKVVITIDGEQKDPDIWPYLSIKENTEIIITPAFVGDKAGVLGIVIGALLVVTGIGIYMWPGASALMQTFAISMIISGAGMMLQGLAMMLFAPDLPMVPEEEKEKTKTYNWSGIRSIARSGVPVPVLIGTHMIGGYIISLYTRVIGNKNYLCVLLAISEGEIEGLCKQNDYSSVCTTSNKSSSSYSYPAIFLNDQLMQNYKDVKWWFRNGYNEEDEGKDEYDCTSQNAIPNFGDIRVQYDDGRKIGPEAGTTGSIVYTTQSDVDRVNITLMSPALYQVEQSTGNILSRNVEFKIEYKSTSVSSWDESTISYASSSKCVGMCRYFERSDGTNHSCYLGFGGTAYSKCNSDLIVHDTTRPCYSGALSKFVYPVPFSTCKYSLSNSNIFSGTNRPDNVRVRCTDVQEGRTTDVTTGYRYEPNGAYFYNLEKTFTFEVLEYGIKNYITVKVKEQVIRYDQVWISTGSVFNWETYQNEETGYWESLPVYDYPNTVVDVGSFIITFSPTYSIKAYDENSSDRVWAEWNVWSKTTLSASEWGNIVSMSGNRDPIFVVHEIAFPSLGMYDIRIMRRYAESSSQYVYDDLQLDSVVEIINDNLIYPNTALLGLEIRASEQLSGSVPNITCVCKGVKVESPDMSVLAFDNTFWDATSNRWEDGTGNLVGWDGTSLATQYTENFAAHLRNFMLNERYGAGLYLKSDDINYASWVELLKDCHLSWDPFAEDYDWGEWWSSEDTTNSQWNSRVTIGTAGETYDGTRRSFLLKDSSNRKLYQNLYAGYDYEYRTNQFYFQLKLPDALLHNVDYQVVITLNNWSLTGGSLTSFNDGSGPILVSVGGRKANVTPAWYTSLGIEWDNYVSDNKVSAFFSVPNDNEDNFLIITVRPKYTSFGVRLWTEITDISIKRYYGVNFDHFHEANGVAESTQSADTFFGEMCHSFRCWLLAMGKQLYFKSNKDEDSVHTISDTNIIEGSFQQTFSTLSGIPYVLESQFTNANRRYEMDQRSCLVPLVEVNKASKKQIGLKYVTDVRKIERELIFQSNLLANCNHIIGFKVSSEFLHAASGDIINFAHSLPSWGAGQSGRVISHDGSSSITIDKSYTFNDVPTTDFSILFISSPNTTRIVTVDKTTITDGTSLSVIPVSSWPDSPITDSPYIIGISSLNVREFRLLSVKRDSDNNIECNALIHVPEIYELQTASLIQGEIDPPINNYDIHIESFSVEQSFTDFNSATFVFRIECVGKVDYFVIGMSALNNGDFQQLLMIDGAVKTGVYRGSQSLFTDGATYYFRCYGKNTHNVSNYVYANIQYKHVTLSMEPPSGLRLFGKPNNESVWNDQNVTFTWNASSIQNCKYQIEIYKPQGTTFNSSQLYLLRSVEVYNVSYTYTFSDNLADSGGVTPNASLYVRVATVSWDGASISNFSLPFYCYNSVPPTVSGLLASSSVGGVLFTWSSSQYEDHKCYYVRTRVNPGTWSSWYEYDGAALMYQLTDTEISLYGYSPIIYIEVKERDWYGQSSVVAATANAVASEISDSIFLLVPTASAGSGDLSSLYDGSRTSGGWTFG